MKKFFQDNQKSVTALRYVSTAAAFIIPFRVSNYLVATEGCYAFTQLLAFLNTSIIDFDVLEQTNSLENSLLFLTQSISKLEIFAERLGQAIGGSESGQLTTVFYLEALKSVCRLVYLLKQKDTIILCSWGKDDLHLSNQPIATLQEYSQYYYEHSLKSRYYLSVTSSRIPRQNYRTQNNNRIMAYTGRRSGITLTPSCTLDSNNSNDNSSYNSNSNNNRYSNSNTLCTSEPNIANFPLFLNQLFDNFTGDISAEQLVLLGEVLYILRPFVYVLVLQLQSLLEKSTSLSNNSNSSSSGSSTGSRRSAWPWPATVANNNTNSNNKAITINKEEEQEVNLRSFFALLVSLCFELLSLVCTVRGLQKIQSAYTTTTTTASNSSHSTIGNNSTNGAQKEGSSTGRRRESVTVITAPLPPPHKYDKELERRKLMLLFYFLRSPLFNRTTLPLIKIAVRVFSFIPLIGGLPLHLLQALKYINSLHLYTSASS